MAIVPNLGIPGGVDLKYSTPNRRVATTAAAMALTPLYGGELVATNDAGLIFRALSVVTGDWWQVYSEK